MASEVGEAVKRLREQGKSTSEIRMELMHKGFMPDELDEVLRQQSSRSASDKRINRQLASKEVFDRIGYGFATPQFVNILFWQSGAGLFFLGIFNGLKTILSLIISSIAQEYGKHHTIRKSKIAAAGLVFGFSFFLMAFARLAELKWVFGFGFLLGAFGVVTYGDMFTKIVQQMIPHERRNHFLRKIAHYGVIITTIALLLSGLLIDKLPGTPVTFAGMTFSCHGFLISFMITAFAFILASNVISKVKDPREQKEYALGRFLKEHLMTINRQAKMFFKNRYVFLLLLSTIIAGLLHVLGTSYYGIFLYKTFKHHVIIQGFSGGFANVALLYAVALLASLLGPYFTKRVEKSTGLAPHLVFGTLLTAILPLVLVYNVNYFAVMAALVCSVIGAAVIGVAQGLIAQKIMDRATRKAFFVTQAFLVSIPYIILVPIGAWLTETYGFALLFQIIGFGLIIVVAPLYFILVAITSKMHL